MKIKTVHILQAVGGVDISLRLILDNIDPETFDSVIIYGKTDTKTLFLDKNGQPVKNYILGIVREINPIKDVVALIKTYRILKKERPNLIHAHSAKGGVIGKIVGQLLDIPVLHTPQAYSYLSASSKFKRKLFLSVEKRLKFNNKILASSTSEKNRAINEVGYPEERVLLFNNSILPITEIKPLSIEKMWSDEYICSVGRPSYQKNIELMLDVLLKIKERKPNIHLVLMGVGFHAPNLESVKNKIKTLKLGQNITMLDWTSRSDIFSIVKNAQLYLTTARYEGLPYAVIESLALGRPVVATNVDGNRDLVKDNFNGFLIDNENIEALASAVLKIMNDNTLAKTFSENALKRFAENFDMRKNIKTLETIYKENSKP